MEGTRRPQPPAKNPSAAATLAPDSSAPDAFLPFIEGLPTRCESWYQPFLRHLAVNGGMSLAAAAAGINRSTAYDHMAANPAFAAEVEAAREYYKDLLEWQSVDLARRKNNPLPFFARLKAEMPARYIDRSAILAVTADTGSLTAAEAAALLRSMLGAATPATRRLLIAGEALEEPAG